MEFFRTTESFSVIEFAIFGASAAAFAASAYSSRLSKAIVSVSEKIAAKKPRKALQRIAKVTWLPSARREANSLAILLNLKAKAHIQLLETEEAEAVCEQVLQMDNVSTAIRGLIFHRKAELHSPAESSSYEAQADELWASGAAELGRLKLWKELAYFFYGTKLYVQAAGCFERSLETEWTPKALFYRAFSYFFQEAAPELCIEKAQEALKYSLTSEQDAQLLPIVVRHQYDLGEYENAYENSQKFLRALERISEPQPFLESESMMRLLSIRSLRALKQDREATEARQEWLSHIRGPLPTLMGLIHDDGEYEVLQKLLNKHSPNTDPNHHYMHGLVKYCLGELSKALPLLETAKETNLGKAATPSAASFLALTHLALLDPKSAKEALELVPESESEWVLTVKKDIAYFWEGDPEKAVSCGELPGPDLAKLLYIGQFEEFQQLGAKKYKDTYRLCCRRFRQAQVLFHEATALHWKEKWSEAKEAYKKAHRLFSGSPLDRARCEIYSLECAAYLGRSGIQEFNELQARLSDRFPHCPIFALEMQCVQADVLLATEDYQGVVSVVSKYVKNQPEKFQVAANLLKRAKAYLALGEVELAKADLKAVSENAPESFLALESKEMSASL